MVANAQAAAPVNYTDETVRGFALAAVLWGVVGMLVGVVIAAQLAFPDLTYGIPWLSYGRLRPLHTNAVIFAFGGCALFATSYHVVQRTCQVPLFLSKLASFHFWTFISWAQSARALCAQIEPGTRFASGSQFRQSRLSAGRR